MKTIAKSIATVLGITASCAMMLPSSSASAHGMTGHGGHGRHGKACSTMEDHQAWAKKQVDSEAAHLQLKEPQLMTWEVYARTKVDLYSTYDSTTTSAGNLDAAAMMRLHANHASIRATRLSKLADATEALQAVLSDDQRKVFNQLLTQTHGRSHGHAQHPAPTAAGTKPVSEKASHK